MGDRREEYKCPDCGCPLEWIDTISTTIDTNIDNFRVREIYHCKHGCDKVFNLFIEGEVKTIKEKWIGA